MTTMKSITCPPSPLSCAAYKTTATAPATAASKPAALPARLSAPPVLVGLAAEKESEPLGTSVELGASVVEAVGVAVEEAVEVVA